MSLALVLMSPRQSFLLIRELQDLTAQSENYLFYHEMFQAPDSTITTQLILKDRNLACVDVWETLENKYYQDLVTTRVKVQSEKGPNFLLEKELNKNRI